MSAFFAWLASTWQYALIPVVSALVGWGTNVLALRMTFYPLEFVGIPPFLGWQGIIPSRAAKMASRTVDLITERLISLEEVTARLQPDRVVQEIEPDLTPMLEEIIDEVAHESYPRLWKMLPQRAKALIFERAKADVHRAVYSILEEIRLNIHELLDLKGMSIGILMRDKSLLNTLFLRCGAAEFVFIERSGLYFGFLFGLVQMLAWIVFPVWWLLPLCGFLVGYLTNWLALKMIFYPLHPRQFGPIVFQGLFLQRQQEVAAEYARLVAGEIINASNLVEAIFRGKSSSKLLSIIEKHIQQVADDYAGPSDSLITRATGEEGYSQVKKTIVARLVVRVPRLVDALVHYAEEALDLERTMRERLQALPPDEFERLLHSIFQEDEWKLILVGAILGVAVGWLQVTTIFAG